MNAIAMKESAAEAPIAASSAGEPITETIGLHLDTGASGSVLEELRERAQADLDTKRSDERRLREASVDPRLTVEAARAKRNEADDAAHEVRRIEAAIAGIDAVLPDLKAAEHRAKIMPAYEKYRDERAAFIKRLRDRWPRLSAEMIEMLEGIERYRREPGVEIPEGCDPLRGDVELEARGLASFMFTYAAGGGGWIPKLSSSRIPDFVGRDDGWLWTEMRGGR